MNYFKSLITLSLGLFLFSACSSDDNGKENPTPDPTPITGNYYLMTVSEAKGPIKNGFLKKYKTLPTGIVSNVGAGATAAGGMGGYRQFNGEIYRRFNDNNQRIIGKFVFDEQGFYTTKSLAVDMRVAGSGNFTINPAHTDGIYFDGATPTQIKLFDPVNMVYKKTLGDYKQQINALAEQLQLQNVKFTAIGQQFLALQDNLLYANITFGTSEGAQAGMFDSASKDVHIAVIDIKTGKWLGTTSVKDTGNIAFVDENPLHYFDEKGDLYFVCQGIKPGGLGGKSKIARIQKGKLTVDESWELDFDSLFTTVSSGKFATIFVEQGKIVTLINEVSLTNPQEINVTPIWKYVAIDIKTKQVNPIALEGVNLVHTPAAALGVTKVDGKYLLRVVTGQQNGYFEMTKDFKTAKSLIDIKEGGMPQGIFKAGR